MIEGEIIKHNPLLGHDMDDWRIKWATYKNEPSEFRESRLDAAKHIVDGQAWHRLQNPLLPGFVGLNIALTQPDQPELMMPVMIGRPFLGWHHCKPDMLHVAEWARPFAPFKNENAKYTGLTAIGKLCVDESGALGME